jgi:hypothetical protein
MCCACSFSLHVGEASRTKVRGSGRRVGRQTRSDSDIELGCKGRNDALAAQGPDRRVAGLTAAKGDRHWFHGNSSLEQEIKAWGYNCAVSNSIFPGITLKKK